MHGLYSLALQKAYSSGNLLGHQQFSGPGKDTDASLKSAGKSAEARRLTERAWETWTRGHKTHVSPVGLAKTRRVHAVHRRADHRAGDGEEGTMCAGSDRH